MGVVVRRAECRHRQVDGGVALACIGVLGAVAQTAGDAQRIGLGHRYRTGIIVHLTAVGVGHRHLVLAGGKFYSRVGRLARSIIPLIDVRNRAVGNRHRSRTIKTVMAGDRRAGEPGDLRQRGHRHRDGRGSVVAATVGHRHMHVSGSGDHGTSRLVLADGEVFSCDAVVA